MKQYLEEIKADNCRGRLIPFGDSYAFFDDLHRFCVDAALVSKTLWPSHTQKKNSEEMRQNRANQLRKILNISEKNAIRNRTLRDSIEHFDERLDQWTLKTNNSFTIVDRGFFDDYDRAYGVSGQPMPKEMIFRAFNLRSHSYIFMGAEYDIALMSKDLIVIQTSVEHFTRGNELELYSLWIEV